MTVGVADSYLVQRGGGPLRLRHGDVAAHEPGRARRRTCAHRRRDRKRVPDMEAALTADVGAPLAVSGDFHGFATTETWADTSTPRERVQFEERRTWADEEALIVREPVGVVAVVILWNVPVGTASAQIGPALAAGCAIVLKLAPEGPLSAMLLVEVFEAIEAAGLPPGVINVLIADREVSGHLVQRRDVDKVSFTGSTGAGHKIMAICGEQIKRVTLELSGKSAGIILLNVALPTSRGAGIGHSGQVCAAITRLLVPRPATTRSSTGSRA
jgi:aldehyde dehydrogenase (NAD+)